LPPGKRGVFLKKSSLCGRDKDLTKKNGGKGDSKKMEKGEGKVRKQPYNGGKKTIGLMSF